MLKYHHEFSFCMQPDVFEDYFKWEIAGYIANHLTEAEKEEIGRQFAKEFYNQDRVESIESVVDAYFYPEACYYNERFDPLIEQYFSEFMEKYTDEQVEKRIAEHQDQSE